MTYGLTMRNGQQRSSTRRAVLRAIVLVQLIMGSCVLVGASDASNFSEAAGLFARRCSGCHTYGKGVRVGPDLKGVTDRHPKSWLMPFIRSSQTVIRQGDPVAVALFRQFKQQRMPDHDLSPQQIEHILEYFASDGPEKQPDDERLASTATLADIELGRQLFYGDKNITSGGQACSSCHRIRHERWVQGGTLGPDLTTVYTRYQDGALTILLRTPCIERMSGMSRGALLTPRESFVLKSYLRQVSFTQLPQNRAQVSSSVTVAAQNAPPTDHSRRESR